MKKKIYRKLFIISFVPFVLLLVYACYSAVFGYYSTPLLPSGGGGWTLYGMEAIFEVMFWYGLAFTIIPILPICLIYQIVYLSVIFVNKIRSAPNFYEHKKVERRRKTGRIIFVFSFVPYLMLFMPLIKSYVHGINRWGMEGDEWIQLSPIVGMDAVRWTLERYSALYLIFWIPALIFQITYIILLVKKHKKGKKS
ncbi:MAG: hypothetical protein LBC86_02040 [Oscillospiraceae bacterium]|jgi:hypothetical protein|nr:hypothetical protein [Oscillospiraceae bacterium]